MKQKQKKPLRKAIFVVIVLIGLIVFAVALRLFTPNNAPVLESIPVSPRIPAISSPLPSTVSISLADTSFSIPETLPVFSVLNIRFPIEAFQQTTGVTKQILTTVWVNPDGKQSIVYDPASRKFTYSNGNVSHPPELGINTQMLEAAADTFMKEQLGIAFVDVVVQDVKPIHIGSDPHYEFVSESEANAAIVLFGVKVDDYPVFIDNQLADPISIYINREENVFKAEISQFFPKFGDVQRVKTLSLSQALGDLSKTTVLSVQHTPGTFFQISNVQSFHITDASIEYRYATESQILSPWYRVSGEAKTDSDSNILLTVLIPAIRISR